MINKIKKTIFVILISLSLTSCVSEYSRPLYKYRPKDHKPSSTPVLVFDTSNVTDIVLAKIKKSAVESEGEVYTVTPAFKFLGSGSYEQVVFSIEPGIYVISKATISLGDVHNNTTMKGLTSGIVNYGAFEIKEGDIAYLGDLSFNWNSHNFITIENNIDKVKKELSGTIYRHLIPKLHKIAFYPAGSKIYMDKSTSKTYISLDKRK
jgi:hypothetical protein